MDEEELEWRVTDSEFLQGLLRGEKKYWRSNDEFAMAMSDQKEITAYMRTVLIDWMNEVMSEFMSKRDTFHLAINFVDRYLARNHKVTKSTF